jgi:hypothetical protein
MLSRRGESKGPSRWAPPSLDDRERRRLKRWLWLAVVGLIGLGVVMVYVGEPMTAEGGRNIVAFELADSGATADEIMVEWGPDGREAARRSLLLDFGWLVFYTAVLMIGSVLVGEMARDRDWPRVHRLGWLAAGLALLAGVLDAVENSFLLLELANGGTDLAAFVARVAATFKFLFVAVAIIYLVVVGVICFFRRPENERLPSFRPSASEQPVSINRPSDAGPRA